MRVLVTGGCGFIGSNFVRLLLGKDEVARVTNLDALTYAGTRTSLRDVEDDPRYRFVHGDVTDPALVDVLVAEHTAVVHFAAESHVDRSIDGPVTTLSTNVVGAGVVFDACRRHQIEQVLHISTDEVYGSLEHGHAVESDPLLPNSPYAASKAAADLLVRAYGVTYDYPITVTRSANNFGPYQFPEKAIPRFVTTLLEGGNIPLYGDGRHVRDWTYVGDACEANWLVLTAGERGGIYNIGAGNEIANRDLAARILGQLGLGEDRIEQVADRPGHDLRYAVDTSALRALGWSPTHTFDAALEATIAWYRDNDWWWRPLRDAGGSTRQGMGQRMGTP